MGGRNRDIATVESIKVRLITEKNTARKSEKWLSSYILRDVDLEGLRKY